MNNKEINRAFDLLKDEYSEFKDELSRYKETLDKKVNDVINKLNVNNKNFENSLEDNNEEYNSLLKSLKNKQTELNNFYNDLFDEDRGLNNKISEIEVYHKELLSDEEEDTIQEKIEDAYNQLIAYRNEVFGYENDEGEEVSGFKDEVDEYFEGVKHEFSKFKASVVDLKNEFSTVVSDIKEKSDSLNEFKDEQFSHFQEIDRDIQINKDRFDEYYSELFNEETGLEIDIKSLKKDIDVYYQKLLGSDNEASIKAKISAFYKKISEYNKDVFGYIEKVDDRVNIRHEGIKDNLRNLVLKYEVDISEFKKNSKELIDEKEKEISDLVVDKTAKMDTLLGKMNLNYNNVEQEALSKKYFDLANAKEKLVNKEMWKLFAYSLILTGALIALFSCSTIQHLLKDIPILVGTMIRMTITVPLLYMIVLSSGKLKREMSIRDQYNYKGTIMTSYRNISTHIKNEDIAVDPVKQFELLEKAYDKILENEVDKLDKSNKETMKLVTKTFGDVAKLLGTNKKKLMDVLIDMSPDIATKLKNIREENLRNDDSSQEQENEEEDEDEDEDEDTEDTEEDDE